MKVRHLAFVACVFLLVACGSGAGCTDLGSVGRTGSGGNGTPAATRTPITAAAGAALIEQAVSVLLERYVDPLNSAELYGAAYRGAVDTLQAAGTAPHVAAPDFTGDPSEDARRFRDAYTALAAAAGQGVDQTTLAYEAIRAITEQIDECHTSFMTPEQHRQFQASLEGRAHYAGIGVSIRPQTRPVVISEVFPDTPAARSGLQPGDAILAVDGTDVTDLAADQIAQLVRGPAGTAVTLTIERPGEPGTRDITITRAEVQLPVLTSRLIEGPGGGKIGYIRLYSFSTGAPEQLQRALEEFERRGVTGWVLDLRGNGGGYIEVLSKIASRFIEGGKPVAYITERGGDREPIATDEDLYFRPQRPLAILIDGGSASSSEALAAAAADYGFARLFGQTTAGCLAGASTFPLADGSALQTTIWKVVSPAGRESSRVGQAPDVTVPPAPASAADPVLEEAIEWLASQRQGASWRPGRATAAIR